MREALDCEVRMEIQMSEWKERIEHWIKTFIGNNGIDWPSILASSVISIIPVVVIFAFLQKYVVGGIATSGVKG